MNAETNLNVAPKSVAATIDVTKPPGVPDLSKYPLLVHAALQDRHDHPDLAAPYNPLRHGHAIRVENNGVLVSDIAEKAATMPDHEALAEHFRTTAAHVTQAIAYATAISSPTTKGE